MKRGWLIAGFLTACASAPTDPSLAGRQACVRLMTAPSVRTATDFVSIGALEWRRARFFGNAAESSRHLRCAVAAYEAATRLDENSAELYDRLAEIYGELGKTTQASNAREMARLRRK